jgi:hypothetical protein
MICENIKCKKEHDGSIGSGRFCSRGCSNKREQTSEMLAKKSLKIKQAWERGVYKGIKGPRISAREIRVCLNEHCENKFEVQKYRTKKFCCLTCAQTSSYYKELKSLQTKEAYLNGKKVYGGTTKWYNVETSNGSIKVQGTYEIRACKVLDKLKEESKIRNWEYTNDRVEYIKEDGKKHLYLLDFKVWNKDGSFYYVEVKGFKTDNDELKWQAVKDKGFNLEVWFDKDLKEKELVN